MKHINPFQSQEQNQGPLAPQSDALPTLYEVKFAG